MIPFAIIPAIEAASTGIKIAILGGIAAALLGLGVYIGMHWEEANTLKIRNEFDKYKLDQQKDAEKQKGETNVENQRLQNQKELSDAENDHAKRSLVFFAERLRSLEERSKRTVTVMPEPTTVTGISEGKTCFDGAELVRADTDYRAGEADRRRRIYSLIEKGAALAVDLNSARKWAQSLPKSTQEVSE